MDMDEGQGRIYSTEFWVEKARQLFQTNKPDHFTNYTHCCECAEHDELLRTFDVDTIGIAELGNPGWDPICFCSDEGKKYYMPALIRLSLETIHGHFYLDQFLFHLESDGRRNTFFLSCTPSQREFIASFIHYLIETFPEKFGTGLYADQILKVYEIWSDDDLGDSTS